MDSMHQITGIQSALEQVSLVLMHHHLEQCVSEAIVEGTGAKKISEIMHIVRQ